MSGKYRDAFDQMFAEVFAAHGIGAFSYGRKKNHPCVEFKLPDGRPRFFVYSGTPSDKRVVQNHKRDLRRDLRENGVIPC